MTDDAIPAGMDTARALALKIIAESWASRGFPDSATQIASEDVWVADAMLAYAKAFALPAEPTHEMIEAGEVERRLQHSARRVWAAMYAAYTPAPSIVTGSDERAREAVLESVRRRLAGMFPGEPRDNATVTVNVNDLTLALAASRPTDAGSGWDHRPQCIDPKFGPEPSIRQMVRFYYRQHGQVDPDGDTEAYLAALATPKPPVDEEARRLIERLANADIDVSGTAAIGIHSADIIAAGDWLARNLTGDGAGA